MTEELNYFCPVCNHKVLLSPTRTSTAEQPPDSHEKLYCPSCEMLVEPVARSAADAPTPQETTPGRSRAEGSNAGGSQRGDMSYQGASQWRRNPAGDHPTLHKD